MDLDLAERRRMPNILLHEGESLLKPEAPESEGSNWEMTYGDLMSVLVVFFVMMVAISTVDQKKFDRMGRSLSAALGAKQIMGVNTGNALVGFKEGLGPNQAEKGLGNEDAPGGLGKHRTFGGRGKRDTTNKPETNAGTVIDDFGELSKRVNEIIAQKGLNDNIEIRLDKRGAVIYAGGNAFFKSGEAEIRRSAEPFLDGVAKRLRTLPYKIHIEGHSDEVPIKTPRFPTNWELSSARAAGVVRYLIEQGGLDPRRLSAVGYAHYRPRYPLIAPFRSKNRRVEIIVTRQRVSPVAEDFDGLIDAMSP